MPAWYSWLRRIFVSEQPTEPVVHAGPQWTAAAGLEYASLSEAERCDLIFAFAALDDPQTLALLERALDDPCESVALAAARAIAQRGGGPAVQRYLETHPGQRSARIAEVLELMVQ